MLRSPLKVSLSVCAIVILGGLVVGAAPDEYVSGIKWDEPKIIAPGAQPGDPPADAIILFGGKDLSQWKHGDKWKVADGVATVHGSAIETKQTFGDCQLHLEWAEPSVVKGEGQGRGNSGVFLQGRYEVQVLDSYDNKTYFDGQCGAIYKQRPPLVNICRKPGEWQSYDIIYTAPRFSADGKVEKKATITVLQNGVLIQNHYEIEGDTFYNKPPAYTAHGKGPLMIQDHGNPLQFRNIWIRELQSGQSSTYRAPPITSMAREP